MAALSADSWPDKGFFEEPALPTGPSLQLARHLTCVGLRGSMEDTQQLTEPLHNAKLTTDKKEGEQPELVTMVKWTIVSKVLCLGTTSQPAVQRGRTDP